MPITIVSPRGRRATFDAASILIGCDEGCDLRLDIPSGAIRGRHARIRKVANRWILESAGDWLVQAGSAPPGKTCWLHPGDTFQLSPDGPEVLFNPTDRQAEAFRRLHRGTEASSPAGKPSAAAERKPPVGSRPVGPVRRAAPKEAEPAGKSKSAPSGKAPASPRSRPDSKTPPNIFGVE